MVSHDNPYLCPFCSCSGHSLFWLLLCHNTKVPQDGESSLLLTLYISPFLGNAGRLPGEITPVRGRCGEGDFPFKPFFATSPPAGEPGNSFFAFASPTNELESHPGASRAFKMKRM